jgi:hypothetical protein
MKLFGYDLGYNNSFKDKMYWLITGFMTHNGFMLWGGSPKPQTSTTSSGIDPSVLPYVTYGLEKAKNLYSGEGPQYYQGQTYVGPSGQTTSALGSAEQIARGGNPLVSGALQQQQDVIGGQYLGANPYLEAALRPGQQSAIQAYNQAIGGTRSQASQAGRYGSGAQNQLESLSQQNLANALTNQAGQAAYQNYAAERGMQNQAAQYAPTLSQARYQDVNQLMNLGQIGEGYQEKALQADIDRYNYEQNLPYQQLANYSALIQGTPMGQTSTTTSSGGGKIVCTAMNSEYGFGSFRNAIWLAQSKDLDPAYEKGYHALFLPLVTYAYKSGEKNALQRILRGVLEHIARHRTADIWKQKRGKNRDNIGMVYRFILEPICYVVGKVGK